MKFAFIEQHASTWPVNVMCRMLGVSRSGYYDWCVRAPSARTTANLALLHDVRRLQARHQGRYGSPRMHAALRAEGHRCSRGRVPNHTHGQPYGAGCHHRRSRLCGGGCGGPCICHADPCDTPRRVTSRRGRRNHRYRGHLLLPTPAPTRRRSARRFQTA